MKRKKNLKGLSLIEIIISIAMYAIIALLLAEIMATVNAMITNTNKLNNRLDREALLVDNRFAGGGSSAFRNPNIVTVRAHIGNRDSTGLLLDNGQELIPSEFVEAGSIPFTDTDNSTHFRFMEFGNRVLDGGSGGDGTFTLSINISAPNGLDDDDFAALSGNDARMVTGIKKVVVRSTTALIVEPDGSTVNDKTYVHRDRAADGEDVFGIDANGNFLTLNLQYVESTDPVHVTVSVYPVFRTGVEFVDGTNLDNQPYIKADLYFVQFDESDGTERHLSRYEDAVYNFDGLSFEAVNTGKLPVPVTTST